MNISKEKRVTICLSGISKSGGIQRFNRAFLRALTESYEKLKIRVFSLEEDIQTCKLALNLRKLAFLLGSLKSALSSDLLIIGHINFYIFGIILSIVKPSLKYLVITHGAEVWSLKNPLKKRLLAHAAGILSISNFTREKLLEYALDIKRIFILPCSVDPETFYPSPPSRELIERHGLEGKKVILCVSRLDLREKYKGYEHLFKALRMVLKVRDNVKLIIVGGGSGREKLHREVERMGLLENVVFTGEVSDEILREYYNLCDLFVMPSTGEGFGIVFLEALACGKPVIAGRRNGSREALLDGKLGLLIEPTNASEIAEKVLQILSGKIEKELLSPQHLREKVLANFEYKVFKDRVKEIIDLFI